MQNTQTSMGELIPTRASLLSRLKDWNDQESWAEFYDTYWRLIYGVALKAGLTEAEAADAVQETIISIAHELKTFQYDASRGSFKAWLLNQTRWRIVDQFRKRQKKVQPRSDATGTTDFMERLPDPSHSIISENLWDEEWNRNLLAVASERVKAKVDPRTFQMFQLYTIQEIPVAKVAKALGVSRTMVYVAKHRIEAMLRKEMRALTKRATRTAGING